MKRSHYIFFTFFAAFLGLIDALYLLREHVYSGGASCSFEDGFGSFFACDIVTRSQYAVVFGIPVALFGVIFYTLILLSVFLYRSAGSYPARFTWWLVTLGGILSTLWFLYLQTLVLGAYCLYCLFSAFFVTLIAYGAARDYLLFRKSDENSLSAVSAKETSREEIPPMS